MTNADKFKGIFGLYATELWSKSEKEFLEWLNEDVPDINVGDMVSRQKAIDAMCGACGHDCDKSKFVYNAPQDEQVIMCPEHYALSTLPSAQSKKFSEVLQDMMDEDYYLFCHTGYSRLAEKDWEWLIEQVKEIEQSGKENRWNEMR